MLPKKSEKNSVYILKNNIPYLNSAKKWTIKRGISPNFERLHLQLQANDF